MASRGSYGFEISPAGDLLDSPANVEALRRLWLSRELIDGQDLGPGNSGDFHHGAWHVGCHVVAGGGVRRSHDGRLLWFELSHRGSPDEYFASVTVEADGIARTYELASAAASQILAGSTLLGFVEGNSTGRTSARAITDPPNRFNSWQRQDFDHPIDSANRGGKVWEHWCTLRDVRPSSDIASSVMRGYVALLAALGDAFAPTVARGRRVYGHPVQLCAFVYAGLCSEESATRPITPSVIPPAAEPLFLEADPTSALRAAGQLAWGDQPRYYMFERMIRSWSSIDQVQHDLREFTRSRRSPS